jgi:hypothetical protein
MKGREKGRQKERMKERKKKRKERVSLKIGLTSGGNFPSPGLDGMWLDDHCFSSGCPNSIY